MSLRQIVSGVAAAAMVAAIAAAPAVAQPVDPFSLIPGGEPAPAAARHLTLAAVASHSRVEPGQTFHVALDVRIADGWVYYSPDPGKIVMPATLQVEAGPLRVGEVLWPQDTPKADPILKTTLNVYTGRTILYVPLTVPADAAAGTVRIVLRPGGQICEKVCIPVEKLTAAREVAVGSVSEPNPAWAADAALSGGLAKAMPAAKLKAARPAAKPKGAAPPPPRAIGGAPAAAADYNVWAGLALALLAGLTLNIMPCVLPIIPLRIYSLVAMAHESRRRFVTLGLAFAGGIVLFFAALAVVNVILKQIGSVTLDINEHFKYPGVRIGLAVVLLAVSANLFGLFTVTVPSKLAGLGQDAKRQGHAPAVGMGLMMAVLATPCSFWLMALALAWAQLQPTWLGTVAIVLIGVGMAAPHALLCAAPDLVRKLPKPGRWMELFKQTMGFLLLPAVVWLLRTLSTGSAWPFWVAGFCLAVVFALWMWGGWVRYDAPPVRKLIVRGLAVALVVAAGLWMLPKPEQPLLEFEEFDEAKIAAAQARKQIVLVKFTAAWCTECHILDYRVYETPEVAREFTERNVLAMKADVTDRSSVAAEMLYGQLHAAPPLTLIYPAGGGDPVSLVGVFSREELLEALDAAAGGG